MNVVYFRKKISIYSCKIDHIPCVDKCVFFSNNMIDRINRALPTNE